MRQDERHHPSDDIFVGIDLATRKMVHYVVAGAGGIPPVPRQRARQALTLAEREVISRGVARGSRSSADSSPSSSYGRCR